MDSLLDYIFDNLDIDSMNRSQVLEHVKLLVEINPQLPNVDERVKLQSIKVLLDKRLVELDKQLIEAYSKNGLLLSKKSSIWNLRSKKKI